MHNKLSHKDFCCDLFIMEYYNIVQLLLLLQKKNRQNRNLYLFSELM